MRAPRTRGSCTSATRCVHTCAASPHLHCPPRIARAPFPQQPAWQRAPTRARARAPKPAPRKATAGVLVAASARAPAPACPPAAGLPRAALRRGAPRRVRARARCGPSRTRVSLHRNACGSAAKRVYTMKPELPGRTQSPFALCPSPPASRAERPRERPQHQPDATLRRARGAGADGALCRARARAVRACYRRATPVSY